MYRQLLNGAVDWRAQSLQLAFLGRLTGLLAVFVGLAFCFGDISQQRFLGLSGDLSALLIERGNRLAKRFGLGIDANPVCENGWSREQAYAVLIAFSLPFLCAFSGQTGTLVLVVLRHATVDAVHHSDAGTQLA
jgi:hypothetical protein